MIDLRPKPIKDYCLGIFDGPHATPSEADDGPIFLGIKNITDDGRLDFSEIRHVSEQEFPRWTRRVTPQSGDVVFTYEATLHRYAIIPEEFRGCLGRRVALVRPDPSKVDSRFLLYYFLSFGWRRVVEGAVITGATVNRIPLEKFPDFPVQLPGLNLQRSVADVLSAYDDLIANNTRRIELLERSARLLFEEWFVRLRYPGHEKDKIIDGVPEGWSRKTLGDIAQTNTESFSSRNLPNEIIYIDIASVKEGRVLTKTRLTSEEAPGRARRRAKDGDVIWSNVRPNLRQFALVLDPNDLDVFSTGFTVLTATSVPYSFLYVAVTTDAFVTHLVNHTTGSSYPAVRPDDFERAAILVPPNTLLEEFHTYCEPLFRLSYKLGRENEKLRRARDLLLPRLMDGRIEV